MTSCPPPALRANPLQPLPRRQAATTPELPSTEGAPEDAARKGALLCSDPQTTTVTGIPAGLRIRAQGVPVADWLCSCGHRERTRGRTAIAALTARARVGICPHRATTTATKRRKAA